MIKLIFTGLWVCAVTLGASYYSISMKMGEAPEADQEQFFGGLDYVKTKMLSVPLMSDGVVEGYVMAQLVYTIEAKVLRRMSVKPDVFLIDEAFRNIYGGEAGNFRKPKRHDIDTLAATIKESVNKRFGTPFVQDVLIEDLGFVSKEDVREGLKRKVPKADTKKESSASALH